METLKKNYLLFALVLLFIGVNFYFIFNENYIISAIPLVLIIVYLGIFNPSTLFLSVAFFTPLSLNIEEFNGGGIGLFLPTEPILFGLMLIIIFRELKSKTIHPRFWKHPITLSLAFYLIWIFITSITSTHPLVSFKFLLMKMWFIVPLLTLGSIVFYKKENIIKFLWAYSIGMVAVISYTLIRHAGYGFGEQEGHWVMEPIFKDHTIYGAAVAINVFFILGLIFYKKHSIHKSLVLLFLFTITMIGLYFSYTRGAWLSVVFAVGIGAFIHYKVKFKYLLTLGVIVGSIALISWDQIQMRLDKNKHEHTTTNFDERISSAANISSDASNLERLNRWSAAWEMFKTKPVFGFGPATYAFEYAPYQDPKKLTIISTNFGDAGNAHSEYLGPLAEMGIFGILSVLIFVATLFYCGITFIIELKKDTVLHDKQLYILMFFIILALSTYFFHGLLNNYLDTDKIAVPIYAASAMIIAQQIRLHSLKKERAAANLPK